MQFHEDAITTLPHGAVLLASAPRYPNRAFRLNRSAYGIQFHIETTTEIVRPWAREAPAMRTSGAFTTEGFGCGARRSGRDLARRPPLQPATIPPPLTQTHPRREGRRGVCYRLVRSERCPFLLKEQWSRMEGRLR